VSKCWKQEKSNWKCLRSSSQESAQSGAPDCPVVHRTVSGAPGWPERTGRSREFHRRRTAIIHRTVRCAPDCPVSQRSAGPTVGRTIYAGHVAEPTARRGHRTCPVRQRLSGCQRSAAPIKERNRAPDSVRCAPDSVRCAPDSVRCATRQKARIAFPDCSQRLLAALGL
jgi:hypothetical protein